MEICRKASTNPSITSIMKVALPLLSGGEMARGLAQAQSIGLYDTSAQTMEDRKLAGDGGMGSDGELFRDLFGNNAVDAVICHTISVMALRIFRELNVAVYQAAGWDVQENLKKAKRGQLFAIFMPANGTSGCSPSACGSCSITDCH